MIDMEMGKLSVTIIRYQRSFVELDQLYTIVYILVVDAPHKLIRFIPSTALVLFEM